MVCIYLIAPPYILIVSTRRCLASWRSWCPGASCRPRTQPWSPACSHTSETSTCHEYIYVFSYALCISKDESIALTASNLIICACLYVNVPREPSPLIGGQGPAEFTLSDVLKFCGQPDVRPVSERVTILSYKIILACLTYHLHRIALLIICIIVFQLLVVPSKGASSIDLNTEYNQAVCLFRVAGDRFTSSSSSSSGSSIGAAPAGSGSGAAGGSAGANEDEDGLADFGVSRKVFSRAVLARGVLRGSRAGLLDGSSAMAGGKADVTSKPVSSSSTSSSASSSSSSSLLLMAEGDTHRCTSYIISRCRELATDNHFGNYKW